MALVEVSMVQLLKMVFTSRLLVFIFSRFQSFLFERLFLVGNHHPTAPPLNGVTSDDFVLAERTSSSSRHNNNNDVEQDDVDEKSSNNDEDESDADEFCDTSDSPQSQV